MTNALQKDLTSAWVSVGSKCTVRGNAFTLSKHVILQSLILASLDMSALHWSFAKDLLIWFRLESADV